MCSCFCFFSLLLCDTVCNYGIFNPTLLFNSESYVCLLHLLQVCRSGNENPCIISCKEISVNKLDQRLFYMPYDISYIIENSNIFWCNVFHTIASLFVKISFVLGKDCKQIWCNIHSKIRGLHKGNISYTFPIFLVYRDGSFSLL